MPPKLSNIDHEKYSNNRSSNSDGDSNSSFSSSAGANNSGGGLSLSLTGGDMAGTSGSRRWCY